MIQPKHARWSRCFLLLVFACIIVLLAAIATAEILSPYLVPGQSPSVEVLTTRSIRDGRTHSVPTQTYRGRSP